MHLERASYEELKVIQAKVEERLLKVQPESAHFHEIVELIERGELLQAVKKQKEYSGMGLKEAKEYVDDLRKKLRALEEAAKKTQPMAPLTKSLDIHADPTHLRHTWLSQADAYAKISRS